MTSFLDKIKRKLSNKGNSKNGAAREKSKEKRPPSPMPKSDNPITSESEQKFTIQPHPAASTLNSLY